MDDFYTYLRAVQQNLPPDMMPRQSDMPTTPIAPEGGTPVYPNDDMGNVPSLPIAPEGGPPVYPGGNRPNLPPITGLPDLIIPIRPAENAEVRFLHAATYAVPVTITIGSRTLVQNLSYGEASGYTSVTSGFRTITVLSARSPRAILYRQNLPLRAGERMTIVVVNTNNGIELLTVPDSGCYQTGMLACLRMVNVAYNSPPVDMLLFDGRLVFADVRYKEVTAYRRVRPGEYGFYIAATPLTNDMPDTTDIETMEQMPIAVGEHYIPGYGDLMPLTTFYAQFRADISYTVYLLGLGNEEYPFTTVILLHDNP